MWIMALSPLALVLSPTVYGSAAWLVFLSLGEINSIGAIRVHRIEENEVPHPLLERESLTVRIEETPDS